MELINAIDILAVHGKWFVICLDDVKLIYIAMNKIEIQNIWLKCFKFGLFHNSKTLFNFFKLFTC